MADENLPRPDTIHKRTENSKFAVFAIIKDHADPESGKAWSFLNADKQSPVSVKARFRRKV